jgi:hypothetical protein
VSGRPVIVSTKDNHPCVPQHVLHLPWQIPQQTALKPNVSDTSVRQLFKDMGGE